MEVCGGKVEVLRFVRKNYLRLSPKNFWVFEQAIGFFKVRAIFR